MKIKSISLHHIEMKLKSPFVSSLGKIQNRECIIVEIVDESGTTGWGEAVAFSSPWYTEETTKTCWHMMEDFLIPIVFSTKIEHPLEVIELFKTLKRNNMAKAGLEGAIWDLYAKQRGITLSEAVGGIRKKIAAGVVVSIDSKDKMLNKIDFHLKEGYERIKVKIKPGQDYDVIKTIRSNFPEAPLMADANSAYTLHDVNKLKALDKFHLKMIEQPLASDDLLEHSKLQKQIKTPICLDESIVTYDDARKAIELGSCQVINIKIGRVGGISIAKKIHDLCRDNYIPVWCGGMLETGISRAHNIAIASLPHFSLPGDISASSRYWEKDIIVPEVTMENGQINVPTTPGIGYEINKQQLKKVTRYTKSFTNPKSM